jgi:hypothetical protein
MEKVWRWISRHQNIKIHEIPKIGQIFDDNNVRLDSFGILLKIGEAKKEREIKTRNCWLKYDEKMKNKMRSLERLE